MAPNQPGWLKSHSTSEVVVDEKTGGIVLKKCGCGNCKDCSCGKKKKERKRRKKSRR